MEIRTGCSGWSYRAWDGPFYPKGIQPGDYLEFYASVFDTVEIDSTFYNIPPHNSVKKWDKSTPSDFLFSPKVPREITHERRLSNTALLMDKFMNSLEPIRNKTGIILIQLPPSLTYDYGIMDFQNFISDLPDGWAFAVEFRDNSWFNDYVYKILEEHNVTMAWSEIPMAKNPARTTSDHVYLRLVGDRAISEDSFGSIRRNMNPVLEMWAGHIESLGDDIKRVYVYSNNHFQGFGPGTVNLFRQRLGLGLVKWPESFSKVPDNQKTLF